MEEKISTLAQRLQEKLAGSPEPVHTDETNTELLESQLEAVSGGAAAGHDSTTHDSHTGGDVPVEV